MEEEDIDLNPVSTKAPVMKKRPRAVASPPNDGPLIITVHSIVLKGGTDSFTKSRFSREIEIPVAVAHITNPTNSSPTILSGRLHSLVVKYFGQLADRTMEKIASDDGEVTENSLVGDGHADYKVNNN